jgi:biotin synthase
MSAEQRAREKARELFDRPLLDLVHEAAAVHRRHHDPRRIQCSTLLNVKSGGCPEDCAYCPQSARYETGVERTALLEVGEVVRAAEEAKASGAGRFCMGAAWRGVRDGPEFDRVLEMVREVKSRGLETCVTLGMLEPHQAERLREAGLDFYNHNLDTSPERYSGIITTRTWEDRIRTLGAVRGAGIKVCCGGIVGLGEGREDRVGLLAALASQEPPPESVPINALVPVEGTPLASQPPVPWDEIVRVVAAARLLMPGSKIRLSAGRAAMSEEAQALCFLAGANSIFLGERLLTTPNPEASEDRALFARLGLEPEGAA